MSTVIIHQAPEEPAPRRSLGAALADGVKRFLFGDPGKSRAETLARFAAVAGGRELLDRARRNGVEIIFGKRRGHADGYVDFDDEKKKTYVFIADNGKPADMVMTLCHELRHVCQIIEEKRLHQPIHAFGRDLALRHFYMKMHEADAFTSEIMMALREKKAGHPEYYEAFLKKSRAHSSVHAQAGAYLRRHRPESFDSEEQLARGLFTHIMLNGLTPYGPARLSLYAGMLKGVENAAQLQAVLDKTPALPPLAQGMPYSEAMAALYGRDFMSGTSLRALAAAFRKGEVPQERRILLSMDRLIGKAAGMDDRSFAAARDRLVGQVMEYYTDEDPMQRFWDPRADALEKALTQSALAGKPPLMAEFSKAVARNEAKRNAMSFRGNAPRRG